jgi:paraquat-inducible protein B
VGGADDAVEIPSIPSDFQHIKDEIADLRLPDLAERARTALSAINQVVGELNGKLGPLADSVKQTSDDARVTLDTVTDAVRQLQADASRTLNSVDHLATSTEGEIHAFGQNAGEVVTRAGKVMDNLNDLTAVRSPLRSDLESTVRDLAASSASLRNFSRDIERSPNAILLGRSAK